MISAYEHKYVSLPEDKSSLLRELLPFFEEGLGNSAWLVGGSIRDLFTKKGDFTDIDIATKNDPIAAAKRFAASQRAGLVVLDDKRGIVRIILPERNGVSFTLDIAKFKGENIDTDLQNRDFTLNAMSADLIANRAELASNRLRLYDPLNGAQALHKKILIPCSKDSILDDPLRIMRAIRFSASLKAQPDNDLINQIREHLPKLSSVSPERIRDELMKTLREPDSHTYIKMMGELGITAEILPELASCTGITQNQWHHLDVYDHTLFALENLEDILLKPFNFSYDKLLRKHLNEYISGDTTYLQLLKLSILLHDIAKPNCRAIAEDTGNITFHGHEIQGRAMAENIAKRLKFPTRENNFLKNVIKNHMRPGVIIQQGMTDRIMYRFYKECGRDGVFISLLSLADRMAARGDLSDNDLEEFTASIFKLIANFYDQLGSFKQKPLLSGNDIIKLFKIKPGPKIKEYLAEAEEAQYLGKISTKKEALELLASRYQITL